MKKPSKGRAIIPTTIEEITITTVELTFDPDLAIAKTITFKTKVPRVSITLARKSIKNL